MPTGDAPAFRQHLPYKTAREAQSRRFHRPQPFRPHDFTFRTQSTAKSVGVVHSMLTKPGIDHDGGLGRDLAIGSLPTVCRADHFSAPTELAPAERGTPAPARESAVNLSAVCA